MLEVSREAGMEVCVALVQRIIISLLAPTKRGSTLRSAAFDPLTSPAVALVGVGSTKV